MKNELIEIYNNWSVEKADAFYNFTVDRKPDGYIWETTDTGVFLVREHGAHFFSNDGMVYKLHKWYSEIDSERHIELLSRCQKNNIRIDIPISHEFVEVNGDKLHYSILQRPNKEHGKSFFHYLMMKQIDKDYMLRYIDLTCNLMAVMKSMDCLLPDVSLPPMHLAYDSKGPYWCDFKVWVKPYDEFVLKNIENYTVYATFLEEYQNVPGLIDTIKIAEVLWKQV